MDYLFCDDCLNIGMSSATKDLFNNLIVTKDSQYK